MTQPRLGLYIIPARGQVESYSTADLAWFRSPRGAARPDEPREVPPWLLTLAFLVMLVALAGYCAGL